MDFDISPEQKMLQNGLSELLGAAIDHNQLVRFTDAEIDALRIRIDAGLYEMGLAGILVSEEDGGLDMGLLTLALVAEELGRHAAPSGIIANALAAWILSRSGSPNQKRALLPGLLDGNLSASFAIRDAAGWLPDDWHAEISNETCNKRLVEGAQGSDFFIIGLPGSQLGLLRAGHATIEAQSDPVDRSRPASDLTYERVAVEALDASKELVQRLRDAHLVLLAADAYGAAHRALELSVNYAQTRQQFDRPIGSFQALKHQLANLAVEVYPSRFLCWYAAHAWDKEAADSAYSGALAKAHVPDVAVRTARACVEAHGGIGYTWEYPLHLFLKRAMFDRECWGGVEEHRGRAAALSGW